MKRWVLAWCGLYLFPFAAGGAAEPNLPASQPSEVMTMDEKPKRGAPKPVTPVEIGGVRYEPLRGARARGLQQDGGILVAVNAKTGKELWTLVVYPTVYDAMEERDVQECYITRLTSGPDGNSLRVESEAHRSYLVNLGSREVSEITEK